MSLQSQLNELIERFSDLSNGLFEVHSQYQITFEQGLYGCAIAKPSKRMKISLGVDREIIIVASTFTDQQQRTIKFVKREIEGSSGRFEPTIAIVLHEDPEGNFKLKNWGRDLGIAILPIFRVIRIESSDDLERALCFELYSHDPFDVTGPVSDDANFYGRRDEAIDLARKLQKGQVRSCLGIRKIGKTSIINRIVREIRSSYECLCIVIDCSRDDIWELNSSKLMRSIANVIESSPDSGQYYAVIEASAVDEPLKASRDALQKAISSIGSDRSLIIVFDEIDYITPGSPTNPIWRSEFNVFWRNMRAIYQECDRLGRKFSLLIGGVSTFWFSVETIDEIENAALSFVPDEYLSPMPTGATVAMLKRLGRVAGFQFDDKAAELVAIATGNMPYWARKCGSYIHRRLSITDRPIVLDYGRVLPLVERI